MITSGETVGSLSRWLRELRRVRTEASPKWFSELSGNFLDVFTGRHEFRRTHAGGADHTAFGIERRERTAQRRRLRTVQDARRGLRQTPSQGDPEGVRREEGVETVQDHRGSARPRELRIVLGTSRLFRPRVPN